MTERPLTSRAQRALALADENAARLGREYVGTEHLLIGLLEEKTGPAARLLSQLGITADRVRSAWRETTETELELGLEDAGEERRDQGGFHSSPKCLRTSGGGPSNFGSGMLPMY